jgi:predicted acyl esterase
MQSGQTEVRAAADQKTHRPRSEVRDGMHIDWDVPITMDDGLVLRADVFRPVAESPYPVILSYGPYAKGLAFQDGYPSAWERMAQKHIDVTAGSSNLYQSWEVVDPEKWVPHDYACVRVDSRGAGRSGSTASPITASTNGTSRVCSRRTSPRCASGKAPPIGIAT